jgi:hypothetical protein
MFWLQYGYTVDIVWLYSGYLVDLLDIKIPNLESLSPSHRDPNVCGTIGWILGGSWVVHGGLARVKMRMRSHGTIERYILLYITYMCIHKMMYLKAVSEYIYIERD